MTLRKWFHLFWTTLVLGMGVSILVGFGLQLSDKEFSVIWASGGVGFNLITMVQGGAIISILSQMGFFSYLIVRMIALGIFRKKIIWDYAQILLVAITLFELVLIRTMNFGDSGSWLGYAVLPLVLLVVSLAVSYWKQKLTNMHAFIPTLFFMVVVTVLEAVPALKLNNAASTFYMFVPLLACNAYQILILHKMVEKKKS
ncbi:KinB-signaling pathway activation protein [Paenibacillus athensensis]|uniref:KinB signaling pathway activation protein n=1 Tax=Paenibacillus athensensis TaxID=1967502 RepID=A0A4Y8PV98_9BACL|nr:KinB-signaling pathway activation protein [Paenibacillus athensensis]MCD1261989.1 KinB-signaling pathway activation protein [Paenibacillus athensensis]